MGNVTIVGNINIDKVFKVDRFPEPGETLLASALETHFGGKGANQAVAAARTGGVARLIGAVGDDPEGKDVVENLKANKVETRHVKVVEGARTGTAFVMTRDDGANSIVSFRGANSSITPEDIEYMKESLMRGDILLVQLGVPEDTIKYAVRAAYEFGRAVFLDPAPCTGKLPFDPEMITFIAPNEVELRLMTGESDKEAGIKKLRAMGFRNVILKAGADGCYVSSAEEGDMHYEGYKGIDVVDTTGAGDTFAGAFASIWADGATTMNSARFANAAAALSVTALGAQSAMPLRARVMEFLKEQKA